VINVRTCVLPLLTKCSRVCILLLAGAAWSQTPQPPVGKLEITSTPPGATVTIRDQPKTYQTNVTLVVSPGNYKVSITGGPGNLNCQPPEVYVQGGKTVTITCPLPK
jgi:hypothetical protein